MGYTIPTYVDSRKRIKAFKRGSKLEVLIKDLPAQSNVRISAECEACGNIRVVAYSKYSILCWCCNLKNMKGTRHGNYDENFEVTGQDRSFALYLRRKYDLNICKYYEILERQKYSCAICQISQAKEGRRFAVDHIHGTKVVRGLLCQACNTALGLLKEQHKVIAKAAEYVKLGGI